jgi:hypothetical protein
MTTMETTVTTAQVYQLYIKATPEQVWDAITKPEFVKQYFHGAIVESTYEVGSKVRSWSPDHESCGPTTRCWSSTRPGATCTRGSASTTPRPPRKRRAARGRSIPPTPATASSPSCTTSSRALKTAANVGGGWMFILSGLKTLCETGKPLV